MKKITLSALALVALTSFGFAGGDIVPVPVVMEEESASAFYLGLGLSAVSTRGSDADFDIFDDTAGQDRLGNVTFLAGYDYNEYIAVEGRYTTSFTKEDIVEMSAWSIFAKPQYPVTEEFTVYALLGFGGVTMDSVNAAYFVDVDDTGFQWGLGLSYDVTETVTIFGDYTSLASGMDGIYWDGEFESDADAFTLGVTYRF